MGYRTTRRQMKATRLTAEKWNAQHKPGIGVIIRLDDGKLWYTKTRSEAWELSYGQPVVMLEGRTGCYDLTRVTPHTIEDTPLA